MLSRLVDSYRKNRSSSGWFAGTALRTPSAVQAARSTISQNSVNGHLQRRRPEVKAVKEFEKHSEDITSGFARVYRLLRTRA